MQSRAAVISLVLGWTSLVQLHAADSRDPKDKMDTLIEAMMSKAKVAGLSLAIIHEGKIVKAKGYGVADKNSRMPVTAETLFQAASISKSVTAFGVLRLVEQKVLSLDADVNTVLKEWKVPENEFTQEKKVTLRRILSHSAGLSVSGFDGYEVGAPVPTLRQVLDGTKPANSAPIRVASVPGTQWKYSGGGYCVLQQMMLDTTAKPFAPFMTETVLVPLGMKSSTWEQPLTESRAAQAATGHYGDGTPVKGRWHVYPETAAAGLWTTATDLARFVKGVRQAYAGEFTRVITQAMARQMLTMQMNPYGLGLVLDGQGDSLVFSQSGRNEGYDAFVLGYAHKAQGVAILINANDDSGLIGDLLREIVVSYGW